MPSISACKLYLPIWFPDISSFEISASTHILHWSDLFFKFFLNHSNKSIEGKKTNALTVKHAFACSNLLRLLLRHTYLIRLNQHRVVMIKHFSPISVWERDTQSGVCLSKGGKGTSPSVSQHCSLKLSLLTPCVPLFLFLPSSLLCFLSAFLAASLCISGDTS